MRGLNAVLGLSKDAHGQQYVTAQAGLMVLEMYKWLAERGLEVSLFSTVSSIGLIPSTYYRWCCYYFTSAITIANL